MSASIVPDRQDSQRNLGAWVTAFTDEERRLQLHDDAVAWGRVTGVLMVVVSVGLMISLAAVILAQWIY